MYDELKDLINKIIESEIYLRSILLVTSSIIKSDLNYLDFIIIFDTKIYLVCNTLFLSMVKRLDSEEFCKIEKLEEYLICNIENLASINDYIDSDILNLMDKKYIPIKQIEEYILKSCEWMFISDL